MRNLLIIIVSLAVIAISIPAPAEHRVREYDRLSRADFDTMEEYRAYRAFIRTKGWAGVPWGCDLAYTQHGNTEDPLDIRICGLRIMSTSQ